MTELSIKVAGLTATGTYDDEVAIAVMEEVVIATEGPVNGTPQQRLDWIIQYIANHLTEVAVGNMRRREASEAKRKAEEAESGLRLINPAEPPPAQTAQAPAEARSSRRATGSTKKTKGSKTKNGN